MMDPDLLLIMSMIVLVTAISFMGVNGIVKKVLEYKRETRAPMEVNGAKAQEIADRTDLIEDRLRVLERIATDRGQLLSDEIDALRQDTGLEEKTDVRG